MRNTNAQTTQKKLSPKFRQAQLQAIKRLPEFKISLKYKNKPEQVLEITNCYQAAEAASMCFEADQILWKESMIVIGLNNANKVLGFYKVSSGGISSTCADPRIVLQFALLCNATTILLAHNHPSGQMLPSQADINMTEKIKEVASVHEIRVLDHIIVGSMFCFSMESKQIFIMSNHKVVNK